MLTIAVFAFIAILVTSTYAWISVSSQIVDARFGRGKFNALVGGTLHNDRRDNSKYHDVYIENWGTRPIYARIRLLEYMEIGKKPFVSGSDINNPDTWAVHIPKDDDAPEICGTSDLNGLNLHEYWEWGMGGQKYYYPARDDKRGIKENDLDYVDDASPIHLNAHSPDSPFGKPVRQTLNAEVMTMKQWIRTGCPIGDYWVIDTDGWAYWANSIKPETATGLLLSSASIIRSVSADYEYRVFVEAQMTTKFNEDETFFDYEKFGVNGGWTENGRQLMGLIVSTENSMDTVKTFSSEKLTASLDVLDDVIYVRQGSSVDLGLKDMHTTSKIINISPNEIQGVDLKWLPDRKVWEMYIDETANAFFSFTLTLEEETENSAGSAASVNIAVIPSEARGVTHQRKGIPILEYIAGSYRPIYKDYKGEVYGGAWIDRAALDNDGFAVASTLPIVNEVVYLKQGQDLGLTVTGISPDFERMAVNLERIPRDPLDDKEHTGISGMLLLRSCTVSAKNDMPVGSRFSIKISQQSADGSRIGATRSIQVVIIPGEAEDVVIGKSGKVYIKYNNGSYRELTKDALGPWIAQAKTE